VADDIFWRTHHGMGIPTSMQGLWRFDTVLTAADLESTYQALAAGPLTRRVVRGRVWPARSSFVQGADLVPIHSEKDPLPPGGITEWADSRGDTTLNIDTGPVWELSVATLSEGGSVVSLLCSHVVADALSLVRAVQIASGAAPLVDEVNDLPTVFDDMRDAARQLRAVLGGVARSLWKAMIDSRRRAELFAAANRSEPMPAKAEGAPTWREPTAIFSIDLRSWREVADAHGGTANTLFTALIAELVLQVRGSGPVELIIPISLGGAAGNSLTAATVSVSTIDECRDLAGLRTRARLAFRAAGTGAGIGPPAGMPEELVQVIGHRAAHRLMPDPGSRDGLASNLGALDGMLTMLAGHRGRAIAARSVHPGLTGQCSAHTRTSVAGWAATTGQCLTFCVAIPDPAVADSAHLRRLIDEALGHWHLAPTYW
jgi:hypothetical protein